MIMKTRMIIALLATSLVVSAARPDDITELRSVSELRSRGQLAVDDLHLDTRERAAAAAVLLGRKIAIETRAAVRSARLGHAEQVRARTGLRSLRERQHRGKARGAQRAKIGRSEGRMGGDARGLIGPAAE